MSEAQINVADNSNATPPPAVQAPPAAATPQTQADWTSGLSDDFKGYVQAKGFKDPATLVESYRNSESLISKLTGANTKDKVIALPEKEDDARWNDIYSKLGKPAKADDYKLPLPKDADQDFAKWAKDTFHGLNLTGKQAEALAAKWGEYISAKQNEAKAQYESRTANEEATLKKEWGQAYEQNINVAKRAAKEFGLDGATIDKLEDAMGYAGIMKFLSGIGSRLSEDSFVSGDNKGFSGALTPNAAKTKIKELMSDRDFTTRYLGGDVKAKEEMERLHRMTLPSE